MRSNSVIRNSYFMGVNVGQSKVHESRTHAEVFHIIYNVQKNSIILWNTDNVYIKRRKCVHVRDCLCVCVPRAGYKTFWWKVYCQTEMENYVSWVSGCARFNQSVLQTDRHNELATQHMHIASAPISIYIESHGCERQTKWIENTQSVFDSILCEQFQWNRWTSNSHSNAAKQYFIQFKHSPSNRSIYCRNLCQSFHRPCECRASAKLLKNRPN